MRDLVMRFMSRRYSSFHLTPAEMLEKKAINGTQEQG
jgi:hypothetical protein